MGKVFDNNQIGQVGEFLKENINKEATLNVVSSIFTIYAFDKLKKQLNHTETVKFLYNQPTFLSQVNVQDKESRIFALEMKDRQSKTSEFDLEIALKNKLDQPVVAQEFYRFIKNKVEVKSVTNSNVINHKFIHVNNNKDKCYLLDGPNLDFSLEGLGYKSKMLFDYKKYEDDPLVNDNFNDRFNSLWNDEINTVDIKENMLEHLKTLYKENSPEFVYYLTLHKMFKDILVNEEDFTKIKEKTGIHKTKIWNSLYNFQQDAVVGAIKKIETYNGCIIADSVGLGKTFEALAIIKYYELRNDRVLVLSPKKLRNNWTSFKMNAKGNMFLNDRFNYDVLNHTDLSRDGGKTGDIDLNLINWGNYDLIVIDESHNFRNAPAVSDRMTRYDKLMDWIIKDGVKTKVLMLSATPVNNRLADLKNQLRFITEDNDQALKDNVGINSIEVTLRKAEQKFNEWGKQTIDSKDTEKLLESLEYDFFNLLNALTIARSRKHIQKYYDTKDIGEFPTRLAPITIKSDIDTLNEFPSLGRVNGDISKLTLPIYSPLLYLLPTKVDEYEKKYEQVVKGGASSFKQTDREKNLVNLMRVNILKRLESSVDAFRLTISRILNQIEDALYKINNNRQYDYKMINDVDDEFEDIEIGNKITVKLKDMDIIRYKQDLLEDQQILNRLLNEANKINTHRDKKLIDLKSKIKHKLNYPINEHNKKILIFTSFSDTAEYLYNNLSEWIKTTFKINSGLVTGSSKVKTNASGVTNKFEDILVHFSPESSKYQNINNQIDILIATDCISEGQNLQDCDYLINYDIHWNPVRIIQRFGRIDRIGSKNKQIQLVNFWPNMELDEYINLESRVKNRMALLDLSATGEDDLLTAEGKNLAYRREQLKKLQEEVIDLEDVSGGISITDFTLDDFLISLEKYMKNHPNVLENYATGIHAVTNVDDRLKDEANEGVIFCLKQINYDADEKAANSLYPFFLVYVDMNGQIFISNKSPKKILDIFKSLSIGKKDVIKSVVSKFNKETKDGLYMDKYTDLLEKAVFDIKGIVEEKGIQSLFKLGKSSVKSSHIKGLNDFELITFMVIKND